MDYWTGIMISLLIGIILYWDIRKKKLGQLIHEEWTCNNQEMIFAIIFLGIVLLTYFLHRLYAETMIQQGILTLAFFHSGLQKNQIRESGIFTRSNGIRKWDKITSYEWTKGLGLNKNDGLQLHLKLKSDKEICFHIQEDKRQQMQEFLERKFPREDIQRLA